MQIGALEIELFASIARLQRDMNRANEVVDRATSGMARAAAMARAALASVAGGLSMGAVVNQLVSAQREFDKLNSSLITATGSVQGAATAYKSLQQFAATTPYSVAEATEAFITMKNLGLDPSERALRSYGNTSAAMGKDLNQMIEAVADAATGEFERLKEFGVRAAQEGDRVAFTFRGVTTSIGNNSAEIQAYLKRIGEVEFAGAMERRAKTLDGAISGLGDSWDSFVLKFAQSGFGDAVQDGVRKLSDLLERLGDKVDTVADGMVTAAKIGAAYVGAFVLAPMIFQGAATALGNLNLQIALARMEMAAGTPIAGLFATSVERVGVAALWSSGMLGKLKIAAGLLFAGFAGWEIGKYLEDQFVEVKVFAEVLTGAVLEMWEHIKLAFKVGLDAITVLWRATFSGLTTSLSTVYGGIASGLGKLGFDEKAAQVQAFADRVRAAGEAQGTFASRTAEARAEHERNVAAIRKVTQSHVNAIMVADQVSEATRGTAKAAAAAGEEAGRQGKATASLAKAQQEAADFERNYAAALSMTADIMSDRVKSAEEEAARNEELVRTFGMTKLAIEQVEVARLEEQLAQRASLGLTLDEIANLEALIEAKERNAAALGRLDQLEAEKKANEQQLAGQQQLWGDIERTAHDTFISIFDSGKSAFDRLKDALKNGLYELLYQMTVKKWIINLQTSTTGGSLMQALTSGSGGSSIFGTASNLFSVGKSIYSGFSSGLATTLGQGLSYAGNAINSNAIFSFGQGMQGFSAGGIGSGISGGAASAGSSAASAIPIAGWIAAGMAMADGLYKKGWDPNNGTVSKGMIFTEPLTGTSTILNEVFKGLGMNNKLANLFSGASITSALFGRKNPEIESQGIQGTFGGAGFSGEAYANILEKGGLFRSDKRYVKTAALSSEQGAGFDATYKALVDAAKGFASTLGIEASVIDGYNKQIKLQLGTDEAKNQEAIAKLFGEIGDELSLRLVPDLAKFAQVGEATSATLQRLVTDYATVDEALTAIGMQFGAIGVASIPARERLVGAAGGLEAFAANIAGFQQNFLSEAERNAPVLNAVTEQLAALGLAGVDTREEFKQVVQGLDLTTEAGAKQYGELMRLQAAFAQVYPSTEEVTAALAQQAEAAKQAAEAQLQAAEAARLAAEEARQAAAQAAKDRGSDLLAGLDSAFSALQSVVNREKALLQETAAAHRNLSSALHGALDGMKVSGFEREDRLGAQAEVRAALAIAKASGVLPDVDSIKGALSVLGKDSSAMFATQEEYLRDFYATQNDIADLAGVADQRLSVEEQAIQRLDGILSSAQQQIDALKGIDTSIFSLAEALSGFDRAIGAVKADPVASAGGELSKIYKELLGRQIDSTGLSFYTERMAEGVSPAEIRAAIKQSEEYKKLKGIPGFANGGDFGGGMRLVGEVGPELEVTGPSRIHSTRDLMASLRNPSDNSAALAAAVERLTATTESQARIIQGLEAAMDQTERNTKRVADGLERLSNGWDKLRTEEQTE